MEKGNITGPDSSVQGNIPIFGGTDGKSLIDSGSPIAILRKETILTDEQIKISETNPLGGPIIVPNPNPKYQIVPFFVIAFSKIYAGYNNIDADAIIRISNTSIIWSDPMINGNGTGFTDVTDFLDTNPQGFVTFQPAQRTDTTLGSLAAAQSSTYAGEPLRWFLDNNGAGDLTDGDLNNSIKVVTYYALETPK